MAKVKAKVKEVLKEYLTNNTSKGNKLGSAEIAKGAKLKPKTVWSQLTKLEEEDDCVHREKDGRGYVYWCTKRASNGSKKSIEPKEDMPAPLSSLGESLSNLINMERQNAMYQQALGQIAAILEQCGVVEST